MWSFYHHMYFLCIPCEKQHLVVFWTNYIYQDAISKYVNEFMASSFLKQVLTRSSRQFRSVTEDQQKYGEFLLCCFDLSFLAWVYAWLAYRNIIFIKDTQKWKEEILSRLVLFHWLFMVLNSGHLLLLPCWDGWAAKTWKTEYLLLYNFQVVMMVLIQPFQ